MRCQKQDCDSRLYVKSTRPFKDGSETYRVYKCPKCEEVYNSTECLLPEEKEKTP